MGAYVEGRSLYIPAKQKPPRGGLESPPEAREGNPSKVFWLCARPPSCREMRGRSLSMQRRLSSSAPIASAARDGFERRSFADRFRHSSCSGMTDPESISSCLHACACSPPSTEVARSIPCTSGTASVQTLTRARRESPNAVVKNVDGSLMYRMKSVHVRRLCVSVRRPPAASFD